jgi:hypothetical protein
MDITTIYAEIQINPRNIVAYRQLAEHYKNCNRLNEAEAFQELIARISDANNSDIDKEQQPNNQSVSGIHTIPETSDSSG